MTNLWSPIRRTLHNVALDEGRDANRTLCAFSFWCSLGCTDDGFSKFNSVQTIYGHIEDMVKELREDKEGIEVHSKARIVARPGKGMEDAYYPKVGDYVELLPPAGAILHNYVRPAEDDREPERRSLAYPVKEVVTRCVGAEVIDFGIYL